MSPARPDASRVCLGVVIGAHGVRGLVRVKSFTQEPQAVAAYGPVETKDGGQRFRIEAAGMAKDAVICKLEGVSDRDKAEAMRGAELYVDRARLPETDEEDGFYYADLIGLQAVGLDGHVYGRVVGVENFGASDLIEIERPEGGPTVLVPFTDENAPSVEIEAGRLILDPLDGLFEDGTDE